MKKTTVTVTFDDEKLGALEFSLRKEHSSVQEHLEDALDALYEKTVPEPLREYLDSKAAPAAVKPKRPVKPAAPKPQSSEPKPAAVKEGNCDGGSCRHHTVDRPPLEGCHRKASQG